MFFALAEPSKTLQLPASPQHLIAYGYPCGFASLIKLRVDALVPAESRPTLNSQQKEAKALLSVVLARLAYVTVCLLLTA